MADLATPLEPLYTDRAAPLERLYSLRELQDAGYGDRLTLTRAIRAGRLPAVKVAGKYKVRERDLDVIAVPVTVADASAVGPNDLIDDAYRYDGDPR